jgi:hypothetical protein
MAAYWSTLAYQSLFESSRFFCRQEGGARLRLRLLLARIVRLDPNDLAATQTLALLMFNIGMLSEAERDARGDLSDALRLGADWKRPTAILCAPANFSTRRNNFRLEIQASSCNGRPCTDGSPILRQGVGRARGYRTKARGRRTRAGRMEREGASARPDGPAFRGLRRPEGKRPLRELTGQRYGAEDAAALSQRQTNFFVAPRLEILPCAGVRSDIAQPIFIVGFPRPGTTSDVWGARNLSPHTRPDISAS